MYFVREAPVIAPQIIVERNETIPFAVKIGESSAIRMHPYMSVYIFMNMESRTRTVSVTIFHPHLLTLYHPGSRIKMNNDSRLFLFEPNFRCTVYISRKNRLVRQLLAGHRGIVYMLVGFRLERKNPSESVVTTVLSLPTACMEVIRAFVGSSCRRNSPPFSDSTRFFPYRK